MNRDPKYEEGSGLRRRGPAWLLGAALAVAPLAQAQTPEAPPAPESPAPEAAAEPEKEPGPEVDLYGFAMLDMGYDFGQNDPNWFDVMRPSKLPSSPNEFGSDGRFYSGVRQSRFGVKTKLPTSLGDLKTIFEFELFGTGVDAGQTTFRLRHAWGELGWLGAGQTWSPFMDPDVFPNSVEYWGPNGMVFFRNVQLRVTPWQDGDSRIAIALERPGSSQDVGVYEDRVELEDVSARFPLPDLSAQVRYAKGWGHVQAAGILRRIVWDDRNPDAFDLSGDTWGWGVNLSSNLKLSKHILRLQAVYGAGIENYMNDAPVDIGVENQPGNTVTPITGKPLPVLGLVGFLDVNWAKWLTSTVGYSFVDVQNSDAQTPSAFRQGHYALANVMVSPVSNLMVGPEVQYGRRLNNSDGFSFTDWRVQLSAKYTFKTQFGGTKE